MRILIALIATLVAMPSFASALATVSAVEPPAWIETNGHKHALAAGQIVIAGDRLTTGAGARVHIELAEQSVVKLGENADFVATALARRDPARTTRPAEADGGVFKGALKVLAGAFRFTTRALGHAEKREIDVTIGVATAGIRGTDLWGKSDGREDLIALLEGKIDVTAQGAPAQHMDQAGTFFVVPHGKSPDPLAHASAANLSDWVPQTELVPDGIAMFAGGPFSATVAQAPSRDAARATVQRLSDRGYAAEIAQEQGALAVVMRGFGSKAEAARFARQLRAAHLTDG